MPFRNRSILLLLLLTGVVQHYLPAQALTLREALAAAEQHSPLTRQGAVSDAINERQRANLHKSYLPQLELNAQATWQSEVTQISLPDDLPFNLAITPPPQDQYRATLDVRPGTCDCRFHTGAVALKVVRHHVDKQLFLATGRVVIQRGVLDADHLRNIAQTHRSIAPL